MPNLEESTKNKPAIAFAVISGLLLLLMIAMQILYTNWESLQEEKAQEPQIESTVPDNLDLDPVEDVPLGSIFDPANLISIDTFNAEPWIPTSFTTPNGTFSLHDNVSVLEQVGLDFVEDVDMDGVIETAHPFDYHEQFTLVSESRTDMLSIQLASPTPEVDTPFEDYLLVGCNVFFSHTIEIDGFPEEFDTDMPAEDFYTLIQDGIFPEPLVQMYDRDAYEQGYLMHYMFWGDDDTILYISIYDETLTSVWFLSRHYEGYNSFLTIFEGYVQLD